MHLLATQKQGPVAHYGRKLGRSSSGSRDKKRTSNTRSSNDSSSDEPDDDQNDDHEIMPDIPVCPNPSKIDLSNVINEYATGDATIVWGDQDKSFGSEVLLEINPSQCGIMHTMINFYVGKLGEVDNASVLIHVIEGSDLNGAVFLHTPGSDWLEDSVTWRNSPEYDKVVGSLSTIGNNMVSLSIPLLPCIFIHLLILSNDKQSTSKSGMRLMLLLRSMNAHQTRNISASE